MIDQTLRPSAALSCFVVAATLLVAGCSIGAGDEGASTAPTTVPSSPSTASTDGTTPSPTLSAGPSPTLSATSSPTLGSTPSPSSPASDPAASGAPPQALAGREFTVDGTYTQTPVRMRLDVIELKRRGDLLDLTATLTNLEQNRDRDLRWQVGNRFAGPNRKDITSSDAFSGAVLTDLAGKKRYLVAADSSNACVCTVQLNSTFVGAGQSVELSATYAAPPAATTRFDVAITSLGTFRDLPVS